MYEETYYKHVTDVNW